MRKLSLCFRRFKESQERARYSAQTTDKSHQRHEERQNNEALIPAYRSSLHPQRSPQALPPSPGPSTITRPPPPLSPRSYPALRHRRERHVPRRLSHQASQRHCQMAAPHAFPMTNPPVAQSNIQMEKCIGRNASSCATVICTTPPGLPSRRLPKTWKNGGLATPRRLRMELIMLQTNITVAGGM